MFHSSKTGDLTTLDDYISRMKEGQTQVYYLAGESKEAVEGSPLIERLVKRGYEVLYMVDPIDEYALANMEKYDGKYKLTNIGREGLKLDDDKEGEDTDKKYEESYAALISFLKKTLGAKVLLCSKSQSDLYRLRKCLSAIVLHNHPVLLFPVPMDGLPTWRESSRLKHSLIQNLRTALLCNSHL